MTKTVEQASQHHHVDDVSDTVALLPPSTTSHPSSSPSSSSCSTPSRKNILHTVILNRGNSSSSDPRDRNKAIAQLYIFLCRHKAVLLSVPLIIVGCLLGLNRFVIVWHHRVHTARDGSSGGALISRDYSKLNGIGDLTSDFVDPWCLDGTKNCPCTDPTQPKDRQNVRHWLKAHHLNKDDATSSRSRDVDVVFLGDSIMEGWLGTSYRNPTGRKQKVKDVFERLFTLEGGGKFEGLALGISGDTSNNLLWRIQNGELPSNLHPQVFWLLIGTNDMGNMQCSAENTLIGILRVVEEIRVRKPKSIIVINAILPRTYNKEGYINRGEDNNGFRQKKRTNNKSRQQQRQRSLWKEIQSINQQLESYCSNHDNVIYFTTDLFLEDVLVPVNQLRIDRNKMDDYLHPSLVGYELWGNEIVDTLNTLITHR